MVVVPVKLLIVQELLRNEVDMMHWVVIITCAMVAVSCLVGSIEGRNHRSGNNNIGLVRGDGHTAYSNLGGGLSSEVSSFIFI